VAPSQQTAQKHLPLLHPNLTPSPVPTEVVARAALSGSAVGPSEFASIMLSQHESGAGLPTILPRASRGANAKVIVSRHRAVDARTALARVCPSNGRAYPPRHGALGLAASSCCYYRLPSADPSPGRLRRSTSRTRLGGRMFVRRSGMPLLPLKLASSVEQRWILNFECPWSTVLAGFNVLSWLVQSQDLERSLLL
jgi:hypothetical protein